MSFLFLKTTAALDAKDHILINQQTAEQKVDSDLSHYQEQIVQLQLELAKVSCHGDGVSELPW